MKALLISGEQCVVRDPRVRVEVGGLHISGWLREILMLEGGDVVNRSPHHVVAVRGPYSGVWCYCKVLLLVCAGGGTGRFFH